VVVSGAQTTGAGQDALSRIGEQSMQALDEFAASLGGSGLAAGTVLCDS